MNGLPNALNSTTEQTDWVKLYRNYIDLFTKQRELSPGSKAFMIVSKMYSKDRNCSDIQSWKDISAILDDVGL